MLATCSARSSSTPTGSGSVGEEVVGQRAGLASKVDRVGELGEQRVPAVADGCPVGFGEVGEQLGGEVLGAVA